MPAPLETLKISRSKRRIAILVGVLAGGVLLRFAFPAAADVRDISAGGVWICRITHDASGYTSFQRAVEVRRRITAFLSTRRSQQTVAVTVRPLGADAVISADNLLVFTVTPNDTVGTATTSTVELANQWARRLAEGLNRAEPDPRRTGP